MVIFPEFCDQKPAYPFHDGAIPGFPSSATCSNGLLSSNQNSGETISSEAAAAMAAVMGLRQQHLNASAVNQHHSDTDLTNFRSGCCCCCFFFGIYFCNIFDAECIFSVSHSGTDSGGVGCLKQPKLGSPATSSQPNNNEINFSMPRLASPAIPNIHSISGLSSLHLMQQQHNLTGDLIANRARSRSNDAQSTPPHTETTSKFTGHMDPLIRNDKNQRHHANAIEQQLKHLTNKNINHSNTTNNNNTKSNNNNNTTKDTPVSRLILFSSSILFVHNEFSSIFFSFFLSFIDHPKRNRMQRNVPWARSKSIFQLMILTQLAWILQSMVYHLNHHYKDFCHQHRPTKSRQFSMMNLTISMIRKPVPMQITETKLNWNRSRNAEVSKIPPIPFNFEMKNN